MARGIGRLSGADLRRSNPGLYGDGGGLWLQVSIAKDGKRRNRSWVFRYTAANRTRYMGLGSLDTISLTEARERARQCRQQQLDGVDPIEHRNSARAAKVAESAKAITFEAAANAYIAAHRSTWRSQQHAQEWPASLRRHIYPSLAKISVAAIDTPLVVRALQAVWKSNLETGSRLRGRIESILDWAKVAGFRQGDNPAKWDGCLEHILAAPSKRRVKHHAAMPWRDVPTFMAKLRATDTVAAQAMEFTILTAARKSEVRYATWSEIDLDDATWIVPDRRMKAGKEHRVPLSSRAVEILRAMRATAVGDYIFPGRDGPLGESAFEHLLRRLGHNDITLHGFRSAFRDWVGESTSFPTDIAEAALAHSVGNKVERAYRRGDALDKRRRLMQAWDDFCGRPVATGANLTRLRAK